MRGLSRSATLARMCPGFEGLGVLPHIDGGIMARKKPMDGEFIAFDVIYEDGALTSNRKVAVADLDPIDGDSSAQAVIEAQDKKIQEMSGRSRGPIKSVKRSR